MERIGFVVYELCFAWELALGTPSLDVMVKPLVSMRTSLRLASNNIGLQISQRRLV